MDMFKRVHDSMQYSAELDPGFVPAVRFEQIYREQIEAGSPELRETIYGALRRGDEGVFRFQIELSRASELVEATCQILTRRIKFYLWAIGGFELTLAASPEFFQVVQNAFSAGGERQFDVATMQTIFEQPFRLHRVESVDELPQEFGGSEAVGGHLDGCRIGFDLGASDFKLAAVKDGEVLYTDEIPWDPVVQDDPNYHLDRIQWGLEKAASFLPRVDSIGGSSAGIIQHNRVRVASLFRAVPKTRFEQEVSNIFDRLKSRWNVPMIVVNDGDVSALAGSMSLKENGIMGLAMGSSEAVGFLDLGGNITGQLNELAFAPVDYSPFAASDEWSGDRGLGVQYFSQQAVNKLAPSAGIEFEAEMPLPERLKVVQKLANDGDANALQIYQSIGVYLGYTVPYYAQFYDMKKLMIFGRVTSGAGGDLILSTAKEVLGQEFSDLLVELAVPDERFRRVGQAVAAASLPEFHL